MSANYLKKGSHNVICDRSGFKIKVEDSRKEWNGLRVDKRYWESRQPQDKIRNIYDNQAVPDPRPEGDDVFKGAADITIDDLFL